MNWKFILNNKGEINGEVMNEMKRGFGNPYSRNGEPKTSYKQRWESNVITISIIVLLIFGFLGTLTIILL